MTTPSPDADDELELELLPLRPAVEAVLMVADEPLDQLRIAQAVGHPPGAVAETLRALADDYDATERGFELREAGGGWRYVTREAYAPAVERFVLDGQQSRLTQAALETLAVVAYRQPVSRSRISAIRGVNVDGVVRTLLTRGLLAEAGTEPDTGATLYRTTSYFLERMGLVDVSELPEIAPLLPELADMADMADVDGDQSTAVAAEPMIESRASVPETDEPAGSTDHTDAPAPGPDPAPGGPR